MDVPPQNGWQENKTVSKSISRKGLMEVALPPHPFGGESKGHFPHAGTVGDAQALLVENDSAE